MNQKTEEKNGNAEPNGSPFDRFKDLARKLVRVPKKELKQKQAAYARKKAARKKRRSA
jgi:hypothetical protein